MRHVPKVGDRFDMPAENLHGVVDQIIDDDFGEPSVLVIALDNGKWAPVSLDDIVYIPPTIH